jgi:nicotinamidase/pyrazinamidase
MHRFIGGHAAAAVGADGELLPRCDAELLRRHGVTDLVVMGLATDYCVRATALDARAEGFAVTLHRAGCRAVELRPGDADAALAEMAAAGVILE